MLVSIGIGDYSYGRLLLDRAVWIDPECFQYQQSGIRSAAVLCHPRQTDDIAVGFNVKVEWRKCRPALEMIGAKCRFAGRADRQGGIAVAKRDMRSLQ